ncbi:hypothetical protein WL21_08940 [Burkholderia ubonensis]|uniref:hypothetical protein n=1 Tax=Burkholderia ubonensis TaxID=101571 RepID=UPI00075B147C|nr:hypothetical protein [Burkholderia ubonensis]KVO82436.1 hypothetical protein WJ81_24380 [Burkholderia ubonensis]KVZ70680.1 hypothetical protein WL20_33065 [Burkholderia ubonensis]KVZ70844.1 hypothetical protein WL21_08940 [Burkholderia ubonensis]
MTGKLTTAERATIMDACQSISRSADALKKCHTVDGDWGDDVDAKAFYEAELRLLARLTALLAPAQQPSDEPSLKNPMVRFPTEEDIREWEEAHKRQPSGEPASAGVIAAALAVIEADRAHVLTDDHIDALENAIKIQRGTLKLPEARAKLPCFPVVLRKMWSGGEVQHWIDENVAPRAAALRDALDHIARVARGSREQSRRQRWIELRALGALNGTEEWRTLPLPRNGDGVRRRLVHRISELDGEVERLNAIIATRPDQPEPRAEVTDDKQDKAKGFIKTLSGIIHDQTVAMQSAIIEWRHGNGAEAGLSWIVNTLEGPGHFPDFDAPHGKHAQFWFNANRANPLPACFCGNPSSSLWMGQGFCCDEHYRAAKARHDAARAGGQS